MKRFEEIQVGETAELLHTIRAEDVEKFVNLTGDDNRLHVDLSFARTTPLKIPVVHGMLGASFISTVIGTKLPGDGALWFSQTLEFLHPVRVGDIIRVRAEVTGKIPREKIIVLRTDIFNQSNVKVTTGEAKVKIVNTAPPAETSGKPALPKVALVLGGSGGIGSAVALQLARDGYAVALHYYRNAPKAEEIRQAITSPGGRCLVFQADISREDEIRSMVEGVVRHFGTVTAVVHCATIRVSPEPFASLEWPRIQAYLDATLKSAFLVAQAIVPVMTAQRFGTIIYLTTHYTEGTPPPEMIPYVAAKSALNGFSKALAVELAPAGITVNLISPGMTDTNLIADVPEKTRLMTSARTPLRRLAHPEDIAGAASYLASPQARFLTGETIRVNGGQVMI